MILPILGAAILYGIYKLLAVFLRSTKAHTLPGPDHNPSWFFGHNKAEWARPDGGLHLEWVRDYGHVFSSQGFLAVSFHFFRHCEPGGLCSRALAHVLNKPEIYEKPPAIVSILTHILGAGLVSTQGEAHRRQRKALNPAFGSAQLRALTGIMLDKSNEVPISPLSIFVVSCCSALRSP
jgi:cytochrome P450